MNYQGAIGANQFAVGGIFDDVWSAAKSVVKSPITKVVTGAAAFVFPPVGVPVAAGLVAAETAVRVSESKDPKAALIREGIAYTAQRAKAGDKNAQRGLEILGVAKEVVGVQKAMQASKKSPTNATLKLKLRQAEARLVAANKRFAANPVTKPLSPAMAKAAAASAAAAAKGAASTAQAAGQYMAAQRAAQARAAAPGAAAAAAAARARAQAAQARRKAAPKTAGAGAAAAQAAMQARQAKKGALVLSDGKFMKAAFRPGKTGESATVGGLLVEANGRITKGRFAKAG